MNTATSDKRLVILLSGRGSNLQAFIDACNSGAIPASIALVVSNQPEAPGLTLAANAGLETACVDHRAYPSREAFDAALLACIAPSEPDLVILAGFMRILTPVFIEPYLGRLLNIHPSLLPKYPGLHTHQRALDAGDTHAGATVHFVTPELDSGPAIIQAQVPVEGGDTASSLAQRVLVKEHLIYPLAAAWHISGRLQLGSTGAELDGETLSECGVRYDEHLLADH